MAAAVGRIKLDGGRQLRAALAKAEGALDDLADVNKRVAGIVADRARETAPVGDPADGNIRDTVRPAGSKTAAIVRAGFAKRSPYGMPLHWGHRTDSGTVVPAQPWVAAAAQDTAPRWTQLYESELERIVATVERTATP